MYHSEVHIVSGHSADYHCRHAFQRFEVAAAFSDLNMLVMPGGRERTEEEYAALFEAAGLALTRVVDTSTRVSIVEGRVAASA